MDLISSVSGAVLPAIIDDDQAESIPGAINGAAAGRIDDGNPLCLEYQPGAPYYKALLTEASLPLAANDADGAAQALNGRSHAAAATDICRGNDGYDASSSNGCPGDVLSPPTGTTGTTGTTATASNGHVRPSAAPEPTDHAPKNDYRSMLQGWGAELARDQNNHPWVRVPGGNGLQTFLLDSEGFYSWLDRKRLAEGIEDTQAGLKHIIGKLRSLAYENEPAVMGTRFCQTGAQEVWVNPADPTGYAIRVHPELEGGWEAVPRPPFLFRQYEEQLPLPEPDRGGDPNELFQYLPPLGEGERLMVLTWAVMAMLPGRPSPWPRPILMLLGPHGSGKTTLAKVLRRLLDASSAELLGQDRRGDLPLALLHQAVVLLDNWDKIEPTLADTLCQAVTGGAVLRRTLFKNLSMTNWSFQNALIITSATLPTNRADLLQRCWVVELDCLPSYRTEERLGQDFLAARPRLLGAMLALVAEVLELLPTTDEGGVKRMADAHRVGRAVARALGRPAQEFDQAYQEVEFRQKRLALDQPLTQAVWLFARQAPKSQEGNLRQWEGEPAALLKLLQTTAKRHGISRSVKAWPETAAGLGLQVKPLNATLIHHGVTIMRPTRGSRRQMRVIYDETADTLGGSL